MQGVIAATRKGAGAGTAHNEQLNKNKNANISQMRAPIDDILTSNARKFNFAHFKTQQPYTQSKFYGTKKNQNVNSDTPNDNFVLTTSVLKIINLKLWNPANKILSNY